VTLDLYGKQGSAPANDTDGTLIGTHRSRTRPTKAPAAPWRRPTTPRSGTTSGFASASARHRTCDAPNRRCTRSSPAVRSSIAASREARCSTQGSLGDGFAW